MPRNIPIDGNNITDWDSFHTVFSEAMGFPAFYGRNMDAWVDCMTYLDDPEAGMTQIHVQPGDLLVLCVSDIAETKRRCPEIYEALVECSSFVNWRRIERGKEAVLALAFYA